MRENQDWQGSIRTGYQDREEKRDIRIVQTYFRVGTVISELGRAHQIGIGVARIGKRSSEQERGISGLGGWKPCLGRGPPGFGR